MWQEFEGGVQWKELLVTSSIVLMMGENLKCGDFKEVLYNAVFIALTESVGYKPMRQILKYRIVGNFGEH